MKSRRAFGPNLRRIRLRRGVSLDVLARATNVPVPLWEAFEDNDLYGWPSGVFARTLVAEYARLIGEDPNDTVNQFCRLFPEGDRRRSHTIREVSRLIDQPLVWSDDFPANQERRADHRAALRAEQQRREHARKERVATASVDLVVITIIGAAVATLRRGPVVADTLTTGLAYYALSAVTGWSVGRWAVRRVATSWATLRSEKVESPDVVEIR
jgi:cytoskeletal protein RodZ